MGAGRVPQMRSVSMSTSVIAHTIRPLASGAVASVHEYLQHDSSLTPPHLNWCDSMHVSLT